MAWLIRTIALTGLAVSGWYAAHEIAGEQTAIDRMLRAAVAARSDEVPAGIDGSTSAAAGVSLVRGTTDHATGHKALSARSEPVGPTSSGPSLATKGALALEVGQRLAQAPASGPGPATGGGKARGVPAADGKPVVDETRRRLSSAIQTELRRVGCYKGEVDGDWGQASQRAMKDFNERVNATLPTAQPDYILLTLLQGHAAQACGVACPMGEIESNGSCRPRSVVAQDRGRAAPPEPAPWAQSLAQIAAATSAGSSSAATAADAERSRPAAEQDRQRLTAEAEARLQATAREMAAARAKAEAEAEVQRQAEAGRARAAAQAARAQATLQADAEKAAADAERARIATAEERKRQRAAEVEARAEADRLARVAESERVRTIVEARRRQELEALAQRAIREPRASAAGPGPVGSPRGVAAADLPVPDTAPMAGDGAKPAVADRPAVVTKVPSRASSERAGSEDVQPRSAGAPRFVGRFVPPPTYRVGRLPPSPAPVARPQYQAPRVFIAAPRRSNPNAIFNHVLRHSP